VEPPTQVLQQRGVQEVLVELTEMRLSARRPCSGTLVLVMLRGTLSRRLCSLLHPDMQISLRNLYLVGTLCAYWRVAEQPFTEYPR
jgi:hypothetical protein